MENRIKETKWFIDQAHSEIAFKVKHLMITNVRGIFKIFDAIIYTTGKDFTTAEIDLWIDTTSISTGDYSRDEHLKNSDFFNVVDHDQISFVSSSIGKAETNGKHEIWGELTMCGIAKKIKLEVWFGGIVNDPWGNERAGFNVSGKINRSDWGLSWNTILEAGGIMIGEEVFISCEIELVNAGEKVTITEPQLTNSRIIT